MGVAMHQVVLPGHPHRHGGLQTIADIGGMTQPRPWNVVTNPG